MKRWIFAAAIVLIGLDAAGQTPSPKIVPDPAIADAAGAASKPLGPPALTLRGQLVQGGVVVGSTAPRAKIKLDDIETEADDSGLFVIGFDHLAPASSRLSVVAPDGGKLEQTLTIGARDYQKSFIRGVSKGPGRELTPEEVAQIQRDSAMKRDAFQSQVSLNAYSGDWIWPVVGRITSPWGAMRILNTADYRAHHGVDIAAQTGTPILAPQGGMVALAFADMFYDGGIVVIDHGQGLLSIYLHMSRLDVAAGQRVDRGQVIGAVGAKGRVTGAHLCWRMKWRGRNLDPTTLVGAMPAGREEGVMIKETLPQSRILAPGEAFTPP